MQMDAVSWAPIDYPTSFLEEESEEFLSDSLLSTDLSSGSSPIAFSDSGYFVSPVINDLRTWSLSSEMGSTVSTQAPLSSLIPATEFDPSIELLAARALRGEDHRDQDFGLTQALEEDVPSPPPALPRRATIKAEAVGKRAQRNRRSPTAPVTTSVSKKSASVPVDSHSGSLFPSTKQLLAFESLQEFDDWMAVRAGNLGRPLTDAESQRAKVDRRKISCRLSAAESRAKKNGRMAELEAQVAALQAAVWQKDQAVANLRAQNDQLISMVSKLGSSTSSSDHSEPDSPLVSDERASPRHRVFDFLSTNFTFGYDNTAAKADLDLEAAAPLDGAKDRFARASSGRSRQGLFILMFAFGILTLFHSASYPVMDQPFRGFNSVDLSPSSIATADLFPQLPNSAPPSKYKNLVMRALNPSDATSSALSNGGRRLLAVDDGNQQVSESTFKSFVIPPASLTQNLELLKRALNRTMQQKESQQLPAMMIQASGGSPARSGYYTQPVSFADQFPGDYTPAATPVASEAQVQGEASLAVVSLLKSANVADDENLVSFILPLNEQTRSLAQFASNKDEFLSVTGVGGLTANDDPTLDPQERDREDGGGDELPNLDAYGDARFIQVTATMFNVALLSLQKQPGAELRFA